MYLQGKEVGSRRAFLRNTALVGTLGVTGLVLVEGCGEKARQEITPAEGLMHGHGLLNRIMLVYDACSSLLEKREKFNAALLHDAALLIRTFVEDYHEVLEEKYLFPRFVNAGVMVEQIQMLYIQHHAGRSLTDRILSLSDDSLNTDRDKATEVISLLRQFNVMYRMHESREDTDIFPAILQVVQDGDYNNLTDEFQKTADAMLGTGGFQAQVEKITVIEKQLGIYDLSAFTPAV